MLCIHLQTRHTALVRHDAVQALHRAQRIHHHAPITAARCQDPIEQLELRHNVRVPMEDGQRCTALRVPHTHRRVTAACRNVHTIKGNRIDLQLVALQHMHAPTGRPVPHAARKVVAATSDILVVHRQASYRVLVPR